MRRLILTVGVIAGAFVAPGTSAAQSQTAPTTLTAQDYAERAQVAMDSGNPLLGAQIYILSYQDHGDSQALFHAGIAFVRAGRQDLAIQAWGQFLCTSAHPELRRAVRLKIRDLQPGQAPPPCLGPRPEDVAVSPSRSELLSSESSAALRSPRARAHIDLEEPKDNQLTFELETGVRVGEDTFGLTWAPGVWLHRQGDFGAGIFVPIFLGSRLGGLASIGLEPRAHLRLSDAIHGELGLGFHSTEGDRADTSVSYSAGVNFNDVFTLRLTRENFTSTYYNDAMDFATTSVDLSFTGKTGKTITGIEAGLALLILVLAASG